MHSIEQQRPFLLRLGSVLGCALGLLCPGVALAATVAIHTLPSPPTLDGNGEDWKGVSGTVVPLHKSKPEATTQIESVLIKGGVHGEYVCFYLEWEDGSEDVLHKPWVWDESKRKYVRGPQREDRLAIQFATSGEYSTDWLSGREFTADMWHWKASRSNPIGLVHDKSTEISARKLLESYKGTTPNGESVYIARPSDGGDKLYTSKRYHAYKEDLMPKYLVNASPHGSVADVEARGVWANGKWHLEIRRKLNTGHADDVVFEAGLQIVGGIAVFDRTENDDHVISENITFQF